MKGHDDNHTLIVNYLLGCLPEAELDSLEKRYLQDQDLFEELQEIEDELIDDYACGALTPEQRSLFEKYFLRSAERLQKLAFAQAMTERAIAWKRPTEISIDADDTKESNESIRNARDLFRHNYWTKPVPEWRQWGAIAAALLFAIAAGLLWLRNRELRHELIAANANSAKLRQELDAQSALNAETKTQLSTEQRQLQALESQVNQLQTRNPDETRNAIINVILGVDYLVQVTRGDSDKKIKTLDVPANARLVRVGLEFHKVPFESFSVLLRRADKSVVWRRGGLKSNVVENRQRLMLAIPAENLTAGTYDLVLNGVPPQGDAELIGHYSLKVERKK